MTHGADVGYIDILHRCRDVGIWELLFQNFSQPFNPNKGGSMFFPTLLKQASNLLQIQVCRWLK